MCHVSCVESIFSLGTIIIVRVGLPKNDNCLEILNVKENMKIRTEF